MILMGLDPSKLHGITSCCPPGSEFAGEVLEVGAGVDNVTPGDRVLGVSPMCGAFAEEAVVPSMVCVAIYYQVTTLCAIYKRDIDIYMVICGYYHGLVVGVFDSGSTGQWFESPVCRSPLTPPPPSGP